MIKSKTFRISLVLMIISSVFLAAASVYAQTTPKNTPSGSTLETRINQRKKERAITLDEKNRRRVEIRCKKVQPNIRDLRDNYIRVDDVRSKTYSKVDAKLWIIIGGLKLIDQDTFQLEEQRSELLKKVKAYENSYAQFSETLNDISIMNCEADPVGFQSLILTARLYNDQIRDQVNDITKYVSETIRPNLNNFSDQLRTKASEQ